MSPFEKYMISVQSIDDRCGMELRPITKILCDADSMGQLSDGYHTFDELYDHRAKLFAFVIAACKNVSFVKGNNVFRVTPWKSKQHHDPDFPMYDGMFIVGMETPFGQITYHYDIDPYWDMFKCPVYERAPEFDGHTPQDAIDRITELVKYMW